MRPSHKILVKLSALSLLLILIYCLQISNKNAHFSWYNKTYRQENANTTENTNLPISISTTTKYWDDRSNGMSSDDEAYDVWCIFTKVTTNSPMRSKLKIFVKSLLQLSSVKINLHLITDDSSKIIAQNVIKFVMKVTGKKARVLYYEVKKLAEKLQDIVSVMSPHFSSKPGTYYSDALFFLSLGLHRIAPNSQTRAVMFDADTKFRRDIKELFQEFDNFGVSAVFGLAPELTPVYRHVLYVYRNKLPGTRFGEPIGTSPISTGYPGYNSGVILFDLDKLRKSPEYDQIVSRDSVQHMAGKYFFKGHLGDQDFYTLLGMERPELIHTIDCGWNRQLCTWWRDRGYADVFANYSFCASETKLWHGNCNTPIPDEY